MLTRRGVMLGEFDKIWGALLFSKLDSLIVVPDVCASDAGVMIETG